MYFLDKDSCKSFFFNLKTICSYSINKKSLILFIFLYYLRREFSRFLKVEVYFTSHASNVGLIEKKTGFFRKILVFYQCHRHRPSQKNVELGISN